MKFTQLHYQSNQFQNQSKITQTRSGFTTPDKQKTKPNNFEPSKKKSAHISDEDVAGLKIRLFFWFNKTIIIDIYLIFYYLEIFSLNLLHLYQIVHKFASFNTCGLLRKTWEAIENKSKGNYNGSNMKLIIQGHIFHFKLEEKVYR